MLAVILSGDGTRGLSYMVPGAQKQSMK